MSEIPYEKVHFLQTESIEETMVKLTDAFLRGGWLGGYDPERRAATLYSPYSHETFGRLEVTFTVPQEVSRWFDPPGIIFSVRGGTTDNNPVTFGTTIINEGEYTLYFGETYFYFLPPSDQTNNRRFGTFVSLLEFTDIVKFPPSQLGYFVWADRTPDLGYRRTDHGINLSSPDYCYCLPTGQKFTSLTPVVIRELSTVPFQRFPSPILSPMMFSGVSTYIYPVVYAPHLYVYVPVGLGSVPFQLSSSIPEHIYAEGTKLNWVTVAPPLSLPLYGAD